MNPGKATFRMIGVVGKVKIPDVDRDMIYISLAVDNYYKGQNYTNWHNNIVLFGTMSKNFIKLAKPGVLVELEGVITTKKTKKSSATMFIAQSFLILRWTKKQQEEKMQKHVAGEVADEDMYNSPEDEDFTPTNDDAPY